MRQIFDIIKSLAPHAGRTILLVEQMANLALRVADRAYILEQGKVVLEGPARELLSHPDVARGYLGGKRAGAAATLDMQKEEVR